MSNMYYCRFENTNRDLLDCLDELKDNWMDNLSENELEACKRLINKCKVIVEIAEDNNFTFEN